MIQEGPFISRHGLERHGIVHARAAYWHLAPAQLYEHAVRRGEAMVAAGGALVAETGTHTGRSPLDKYVVREPETEGEVWWGEVNRPIAPEAFAVLLQRVRAYLQNRDLFVFDGYAGADPRYRLPVRVVTEYAWHNLFAQNMFIREQDGALLADFEPGFTVVDAASFKADPERDGTRSSTFIALHLTERLVLIGGTAYAGEIKKSVFSAMNYLLPKRGVMPMHCSANYGAGKDDVALFFGLSGTGKTTLSADPERTLIGDDEHGWSDDGVFNVEGGCYAKVIRLDPEGEPAIYRTTRTFGTVLENVVCDPATRRLDLDDDRLTENTRSSYPLSQLDGVDLSGVAGHPRNVVFSDRRRLRRPAADQPALRGPGDVPLPLRLHRQGGRHRARRHRAQGDLLGLLRRPLHAAPSGGLRPPAGREDRPPRRPGLADQHRLDRRSLRRGDEDQARRHPAAGPRRLERRAGRRRNRPRPRLRPHRAEARRRGARRAPPPPRHLARPGGLRRQGRRAGGDVRQELREVRRRGERGGPRRRTAADRRSPYKGSGTPSR